MCSIWNQLESIMAAGVVIISRDGGCARLYRSSYGVKPREQAWPAPTLYRSSDGVKPREQAWPAPTLYRSSHGVKPWAQAWPGPTLYRSSDGVKPWEQAWPAQTLYRSSHGVKPREQAWPGPTLYRSSHGVKPWAQAWPGPRRIVTVTFFLKTLWKMIVEMASCLLKSYMFECGDLHNHWDIYLAGLVVVQNHLVQHPGPPHVSWRYTHNSQHLCVNTIAPSVLTTSNVQQFKATLN